jgi:hypothetical protein
MNRHNSSLSESTQRYREYNDSIDRENPQAAETPQKAIAKAIELADQAEARMRRLNHVSETPMPQTTTEEKSHEPSSTT